MTCSHLSDQELMERLDRLVTREKRCSLEVIVHLAEFDARRLSEKHGHPSLYIYCTDRLGYTEAQAYKRIQVARAINKFPVALRMLKERGLGLTAVLMLSPHMTEENHAQILERAIGMSTRELQMLIATVAPRPDAADCVRRLHCPHGCAPDIPQRIEPLSEDRVLFRFTGSQELRSKLEKVRTLLKRKYPHGDIEDIFQEALDNLLEKLDPALRHERRLMRRKRSQRSTVSASGSEPRPVEAAAQPAGDALPRTGTAEPGLQERIDQRIPQAVRDEVWVRDGGRCAFRTADGSRCTERAWLEYDHILPRAFGGSSEDPSNIRLLCRSHNQMLARELFGAPYVEQRVKERKCAASREPPGG